MAVPALAELWKTANPYDLTSADDLTGEGS